MRWIACTALWVLSAACTGASLSGEPSVSSPPGAHQSSTMLARPR